MEEELVAIPVRLNKRKQPEPSTTATSTPEPTEKKKTPATEETTVDRGWSFFTETESKHLVDSVAHLLRHSSRSAVSIKQANTHFVLHLSNLAGTIALNEIEQALRVINVKYEVRGATISFGRQFIAIRFRVPTTTIRTPHVSNVVCVAQRSVDKHTHEAIPKDARRDPNDWLMLTSIISHAENVLGERTPADLNIEIDSPEGDTLTHTGVVEGKQTRSNYRVRITGYTQLELHHLRSFVHVLPFHIHPPSIDFNTCALHAELEKYLNPICGQVTSVHDDEAALFGCCAPSQVA